MHGWTCIFTTINKTWYCEIWVQKPKPSVINCARHQLFTCELFCKQCKTAVCSKCISSKYHQKHALTELSGIFPSKIKEIEKDLENIEKYILPEYNTLKTQLKMCLKVKLYLIDTKRFGKTFDNKRRSRYRKLNPKWKLYCPRWIYQTPTSKRRVAKYCWRYRESSSRKK